MKRIALLLSVLLLSVASFAATFTAKDGKFSVDFPGTPTVKVTQNKATTEENYTATTYKFSDDAKSEYFMVFTADYPAGGRINVDAVKNVLVGDGEIKSEGHPKIWGLDGIELIISKPKSGNDPALMLMVYIFSKGDRLYQIVFAVPTEKTSHDNFVDGSDFINSFKLN